VAQAGSLREAVSRLERENALAQELPPIPASETLFALVMPEGDAGHAGSIWPVSGIIKEPFGQVDGQGGISRGVTITAPANAIVISPLAGSVRFAGPFLNYKHILILEHSGGYHSLIAGLARIDAVAGDAILAGEPIGAMGDPAEGGSDLYFELRQNGQPINPQQALAAGAVKGSG
jgi:septal ring factor EnvC (AmiA/AmiB activator)